MSFVPGTGRSKVPALVQVQISGGQKSKAQVKAHTSAQSPSAIPARQAGTGGAVGFGATQISRAGLITQTSGHNP